MAGLDESPALLERRDERGRTWLHRCAAIDVRGREAEVDATLAIAADSRGMTALHDLLKKSSAPEHVVALMRFHPRLDLPGPDGRTAATILAGKRDPVLRAFAT